jgi:hypothetical protein
MNERPHLNNQRNRTLQDTRTSLQPAEVLAAAKAFFGSRNGVYTAFPERESANSLVLRGQGGEEIVIAAHVDSGTTRVSGSSYLFDQQLARFFSSLPVAAGVVS